MERICIYIDYHEFVFISQACVQVLVQLTDSRRDLRSEIVRRDYPYPIDRVIDTSENELKKKTAKRARGGSS